ncbi:hypothetical protein SRHO_G00155550 [Serrasalmus rhombeus]
MKANPRREHMAWELRGSLLESVIDEAFSASKRMSYALHSPIKGAQRRGQGEKHQSLRHFSCKEVTGPDMAQSLALRVDPAICLASDTPIQSCSRRAEASLSAGCRASEAHMQPGDSRPFKNAPPPLRLRSPHNGAHFCQQRAGPENPHIYSMEKINCSKSV